MKFIGVDPGVSGGIAFINDDGETAVTAMPKTERDIFDVIRSLSVGPCYAVIENVHSMPKQGVASSFKFGMNYGGIFGACGALGLQTTLVTPQKWKKEILSNFEEKDKQAAIDYATLTFPEISLIPQGRRVPQDGIADALRIAAYGLNQYQAK